MANARIQELEQLKKQQDEMLLRLAELQKACQELLKYTVPDMKSDHVGSMRTALSHIKNLQAKLQNLSNAIREMNVERYIYEENAYEELRKTDNRDQKIADLRKKLIDLIRSATVKDYYRQHVEPILDLEQPEKMRAAAKYFQEHVVICPKEITEMENMSLDLLLEKAKTRETFVSNKEVFKKNIRSIEDEISTIAVRIKNETTEFEALNSIEQERSSKIKGITQAITQQREELEQCQLLFDQYKNQFEQHKSKMELEELDRQQELDCKKEQKKRIEESVEKFDEKLTSLQKEVNELVGKFPADIIMGHFQQLKLRVEGGQEDKKEDKVGSEGVSEEFVKLRQQIRGTSDAGLIKRINPICTKLVTLKTDFLKLEGGLKEPHEKTKVHAPKETVPLASTVKETLAPAPVAVKKPVPAAMTHEKCVEEIVEFAKQIFSERNKRFWQSQHSFSSCLFRMLPNGIGKIYSIDQNMKADDFLRCMIAVAKGRENASIVGERAGATAATYQAALGLADKNGNLRMLSEKEVENFKRTFDRFLKKEETNQSIVASARRAKV